nr:hypothetical protein [uncultured Cohaesibacter sp.]
MQPKRRLPLLLLLCLAAFLIFRQILVYNDFCTDQRRWLQDQEFFEAAMRSVYEHYPPQRFRIPGFFSKKIVNHVEYQSYEDFVQKNPNCCEMSPTGWKGISIGIFRRLTGYSVGFVKVEFRADADGLTAEDRAWILENRGPSGFKSEQFRNLSSKNLAFVPMTNCGKIWRGY